MAHNDEVNNDDPILDFIFEKLYNAFNDLLCDLRSYLIKIKNLRKKINP